MSNAYRDENVHKNSSKVNGEDTHIHANYSHIDKTLLSSFSLFNDRFPHRDTRSVHLRKI